MNYPSKWIRHRGSQKMPIVLSAVRFEVRQRDGVICELSEVCLKSPYIWMHLKGSKDIMAYRIIETEKTKTKHVTPRKVSVLDDVKISPQKNKYQRIIKDVTVDVYDVLDAFGVTCPAMAHAIKKMLMPGLRGHKDAEQDKREAIQAIERSIELHKE